MITAQVQTAEDIGDDTLFWWPEPGGTFRVDSARVGWKAAYSLARRVLSVRSKLAAVHIVVYREGTRNGRRFIMENRHAN